MNLARTIRALYEKKNSPPWDDSKKDYAGAAKELHDYAMKDGGIDKADFLKVANQIRALAKMKSPSVGARMMRDVQALDTDVREKVYSVLKKHGLKEELSSDLEIIEEAMVRGKEVFDKTFANRKQAVAFADKNGGYVKQVGRVFYVFKGEPVKEAEDKSDEDENEPCPECGEYPCECDDVKTTESSCGKKMKEEVELQESPMVTTSIPNNQSDHVAKLQRLAKENGVEFSRQGRTVTLKGKRMDVRTILSKMAYAGGSQPKMVPVKEEVELTEREDTAMQVARALKKMGVKPNDKEAEVTKKIPSILDKMNLTPSARRLISRDPDFLGDVFDSLKEDVELDEGYKTPAEASAYEAGKKAVAKGISYDDNPNKKGTKEYTAWSRGHNDARARKIARKEEVELDVDAIFEETFAEGKSSTGYELYHKDFSTAMKHAYDHAKKKFGIEIDPKEIDDKVASGPRKPSKGKTNSYRLLGKDGKKAVQIQVYGMDNGKYELNMYKEEVEVKGMDLEEAIKAVVFGLEEKKAPVTKKDDDGDGMDPVGQEDGDVDNDGDKDSSDDYLKNRRKEVGKAIKKDKKKDDKKDGEGATTGSQDPVDTKPSVEESAEMTDAEKAKVEKIKAKLDAKKDEFVKKYGDRAKEVIARTAIKMAKKDS